MVDKQSKIDVKRIIAIVVFIIGFSILLYPLFSRVYYDYQSGEEISDYKSELEVTDTNEINKRLQLAYAYNSSLMSNEDRSILDPFNEEMKEEGIVEYARMIEVNEKIGVLTIPKLGMQFPIYAGTNELVLQKGIGHLEGTSLPIGGLNTNSILTGHRGLPENKLFTDLDKMGVGDVFYLETMAGKLAYKVIETKVIEPTDIGELSIVLNKDLVTLLTCTPYMINSHRLLVIGERTDLPVEVEKEEITVDRWSHMWNLLYEYRWIILILFVVIGVVLVRHIYKKKAGE